MADLETCAVLLGKLDAKNLKQFAHDVQATNDKLRGSYDTGNKPVVDNGDSLIDVNLDK